MLRNNPMDRLDAMHAFVTAVDRGSLSAAARTLQRSAASITRAIASLETRLGTPLLHRTTRSMKLTEAGDRYLSICRRVLSELADAERLADDALDSPHGTLTVTAPAMFGALHVRPVVDSWLSAHADVRARLLLLDRVVNIVDEGIDVAIRIAHLPDSSLIATRLGDVQRIVCASPRYLTNHGHPHAPHDLAGHRCIALSALTPGDTWRFGAGRHGGRPHQVRISPRLIVNTAEAAIASAIDGHGVTSVLSYQVANALHTGQLVRLLGAFEPDPLPVHLVYSVGSKSAAKLRTFVDHAVPRLRAAIEPSLRAVRTKPKPRRS